MRQSPPPDVIVFEGPWRNNNICWIARTKFTALFEWLPPPVPDVRDYQTPAVAGATLNFVLAKQVSEELKI